VDNRKIIHIDMDCFYAAVEVKDNPKLAGKPIAVGGPPDSRSVLTTASYEARKFGVRSAMPSSRAVRICPDLIIVPPHFERYREESHAVREIFKRFTDKIEPLSLDEAYLDVTKSDHFSGSATLIAKEIRALIKKETGLTASAGIAPNKFLAKIASDWKKPNGQFVVKPEDVKDFMPSLKIGKIYGVGKVTEEKMNSLGLFVCEDIQNQSINQMNQWFGSRGPEFWNLSHGIDNREVESNSERKSLSVEETFSKDLEKIEDCFSLLPNLFNDWEERMNKSQEVDRLKGLVVKIKFYDFTTTTHEVSTNVWPTIEVFKALLEAAWERHSKPFRLIGIGARLSGTTPDKNEAQIKFSFLKNMLKKSK
jgi:DNA polymerase IV